MSPSFTNVAIVLHMRRHRRDPLTAQSAAHGASSAPEPTNAARSHPLDDLLIRPPLGRITWLQRSATNRWFTESNRLRSSSLGQRHPRPNSADLRVHCIAGATPDGRLGPKLALEHAHQ